METQWPRLALVWMYFGDNPADRRDMIAGLDYPHVDILVPDGNPSLEQLAELVAADADICVFWADDGKPVGHDFLREMARPLLTPSEQAVMHLWAGNALAVSRNALVSTREGHFQPLENSFMKLALGFIDVGGAETEKSRVAFSSTERLAPLCGEPVGRVS